jgi:hypothetical protein
MDKNQIKNLGQIVGFTVGSNPQKVSSLLKYYGIDVDPSEKAKLISESIGLMTSNPEFSKAFMKLSFASAKQFNRVVQEEQYSSVGETDWGSAITSVLGSATNIFTTIKATDAQKKLAEQQAKITAEQTQAQIALGQQNLEIEKLKLAQIQASSSTAGSSKILIIGGIVFVVLLIGGVIFMSVKKK